MKQTKKLILLAVALVALVCLFVFGASAYNGTEYMNTGIYYEISNGEVTITDADESIVTADIPEVIDGCSVTEIGREAFFNCDKLERVIISKTINCISYHAFVGCVNLKQVDISDLEKWCSIQFANNLSNPLYFAHYLYLNGVQINKLVIPDTITMISSSCFSGFYALEEIEMPSCIEFIGTGAFMDCINLTNVIIPNGVTNICSSVFSNCTNLKSVTFPDEIVNIGSEAFFNCVSLGDVILPDKLESIGFMAFQNCKNITEIIIPRSVKTIGFQAFSYCSGLENIVISDGVNKIEHLAFAGCTGLIKVDLPRSIVDIGDNAFASCVELSDIIIRNNNCKISKKMNIPLSTVVYGYKGSTAERYCEEVGNRFIPICDHTLTATVNALPPTCTTEGYTGDAICNECGEVITKGEIVAKLAHSYKSKVTAPTCSSKGYTTYTCSVCEDSYKADETEKLPHIAATINAIPPTCTTEGYSGDVVCSACGEIIAKGEIVAKLTHSYKSKVTAPTCSSKGYTTYICSVCNDSYIADETSKLEHILKTVNTISSTCTTEGYTGDIVCSECGEVITKGETIVTIPHTDSDNDGVCDTCGQKLSSGNLNWLLRILKAIHKFVLGVLQDVTNLIKGIK